MDPYLSRLPGAADSEYFPTFGARSTSTPAVGAAGASSDTAAAEEPSSDPDALFGKEGITFHDVLEMVNPLQHLPIIGTIYRELTGDETKPGVRLVGGLLFGGPTGLLAAGINNAIQYHTGRDIGGEVIAAVTGKPMVTPEAEARYAEYKAKHGGGTAVAEGTPAPQVTAQIATNGTSQTPASDAVPTVKTDSANAAPAVSTGAAALPGKGSIGAPPATSFPGGGMPSGLAAEATGLSGKAGLPSAGSITPAALMTQLGQQPQAGTGRGNGLSPGIAAALPIAASIGGPPVASPPGEAQQKAEEEARQQAAQTETENAGPALRMPARVAMEPRMPAPGRNSAPRAPIVVSPDAVTASASSQMPTTPASDAPIILGTPNAAPANLTPTAQIPDAMLRALDKYDALIKNRRGGKLDQAS